MRGLKINSLNDEKNLNSSLDFITLLWLSLIVNVKIKDWRWTLWIRITVKPVYNSHIWDLKKAAVWQRCLIKVRVRLVVDDSKWPLLTGGRCSQVVVSTGLTVHHFTCYRHNIWQLLQLGMHIEIVFGFTWRQVIIINILQTIWGGGREPWGITKIAGSKVNVIIYWNDKSDLQESANFITGIFPKRECLSCKLKGSKV